MSAESWGLQAPLGLLGPGQPFLAVLWGWEGEPWMLASLRLVERSRGGMLSKA